MVGDNLIPPTPRVMLDLETWGTRPGSVIVSLAAVRFDTAEMLDDPWMAGYSILIDAQSCLDAGLKVDAATLYWWMLQDEKARRSIVEGPGMPKMHLAEAVGAFIKWLPGETFELWCNGANFDEPVLTEAFRAVGRVAPWTHRQVRCFRTLKHLVNSLPGEPVAEPARKGTHHDALDDAEHQARWALALLRKLGRGCYPAP